MDDKPHSDLNGFSGYVLGRMSAQSEHALEDFSKAFKRRFRPATPAEDLSALIAENEMLRQQLAATQAGLRELKGIYNRLKECGQATS